MSRSVNAIEGHGSLTKLVLCFLKRGEPDPAEVRTIPFVIPLAGFVVSTSFPVFEGSRWP